MKTKIIGFVIFLFAQYNMLGQTAVATSEYSTQTGTLGNTYSWIDCSSGTTIVSGDDVQATFLWPFTFSFYDNTYTTSKSLSVTDNGFIKLNGNAATNANTASSYALSSTSTELGQIIAMAVYDGNVSGTGWVRYLVTGTSPNRILTIEYNDLEIDYNDDKFADVQVSFYETSNKIVLKLGSQNINKSGVDMGLHSGVNGYFNKWQEVLSGTTNAWIEYTRTSPAPSAPSGPEASWNYDFKSGNLGTTYSWIDCAAGSSIVTGDDVEGTVNWPFNFNFYDNSYTTSNSLSLTDNGFIRLDGTANTNYADASAYTLASASTGLGQIIAMGVYDGKIGDGGGWVKSLVTGTAPNRIFTIEYNNIEINYNAGRYADIQVSFYESLNKIVLKYGADNVTQSGADLGIHSGVSSYFNKWQEVASGTNNTWIEYTPPYVEVNATIGTLLAYYPTLKDAFDKINDGTHKGNVTIKIKRSTEESSSAILNGSGVGNANYTSVNIYPTVAGVTISGNMATPLIDFNGADNVTIDGRVNGTGTSKDLIIENTSVSATAGTSTIRFMNDATNNTIKYATIKGSGASEGNGVVSFSTTTGSTGNDSNILDSNNITNSADATRPVNAIYSLGTAGKDNSGNIVSNNNIYNFLRAGTNSNGINLLANNNAWTLDGNSFYETTSFSSTGSFNYNAIQISNTSGNDFKVLNNYIGGSAKQCGGTAWTKTSSSNNTFNAISLSVGTSTASSIQNNTIENFNWSNSGNANWTGINVLAGNVNVGTTTGNIIGDTTGTDSILITGATNGLNVYGISIASTGTVDCQKNSIGSITTANGAAFGSTIYGIYKTATAGTVTINNNIIGSSTVANSINAGATSLSNSQAVYGIYNEGIGSVSISNNSISNLRNGTTNTATGTLGLIHGIKSVNGTTSILNNTIYALSIANANTNATSSASVCGISLTGTTLPKTIKGNIIYNLSNTYASFSGNVIGLYYEGSTAGTNVVSGNFIHSLSVTGVNSTAGAIYGIKTASGLTTYANNVISLGGNTKTTVYGIYETGAANNNNSIYFNTIYLSGTVASGSTNKSYSLYSNTSNNVRNLRNNIFMNARSTTGGSNLHYAAYFNYSASTNITLNYNDYYVSGTGGVLGYWNNSNQTNSIIITGQDTNSVAIDPIFGVSGGTNFSDYTTAAVLTGVTGTSILTDYEGITRNNPPKMGALESSLEFIWQGNTSTDFGTASNWENGIVPPNGVHISFATVPTNDCILDVNRTLNSITNTQSAKKLVVNGKQLTITGNLVFSNGAQINATSASSTIIFGGTVAQNIPVGAFVSNTIDGLTVDNSNGLSMNEDIIVQTQLTLTKGVFTIGGNTLTLNGAITTTLGTLTGGSTSNISIGGSGASTNLPSVLLYNLTLNRSNGISLGGNVTVEGALILTTGTLTVQANTLTISGNTLTSTSGNINASHASSSLVFTNSSAITLPSSIFSGNVNNLTINGAGLTSSSDMLVNGILNLQSENPSAVKGTLDMGSYTLTMGVLGTTIGIGDVVGIVKREHTFLQNTEYTFGNQYTNITFNDGNLKPTWVSIKITLGSVPSWTSWTPIGKVKRLYQIARSENASTSSANINMHYLPAELDATNNSESLLTFWHKFSQHASGEPHEHGNSGQDLTNHSLQVTGLILDGAASTDLNDSQVAIAYSLSTKNTWKGEVVGHQTEWEQPQNWTAGYVPLLSDEVLIPGGLTYYPSLTASANAVAGTIEIEPGASISANSYTITVSGASGAWSNQGAFNAGTGNVIFNHGVLSEIVTIAGTTNFYNIEVGANTSMQPVSNSVLRIANLGIADSTSIVDFSTINNTVEWNGVNQTIVHPNGIGGNKGYYNLIISGSGIKTMPSEVITITNDFTISGTASVTALSDLTIGGKMKVESNAAFITDNFNHTVSGNLDVDGVFTNSDGTFTLNGIASQSIIGSTPIVFNNLVLNNTADATIFTNVTVNNTLTLTNGKLNVESNLLTINGNIAKTAGFINVINTSSLVFGGTTELTLSSNLFYTTPNISNLTINNTGGIILGSDFTVNGILNLQSINPSSQIIGSLDTGSYILNMGATATTIGAGDVTGKVRRTTILPNIEYTFGNQYSSVIFANVGTLPSEITMKISIGSAPSWNTDGVKRINDIIQIGANGTRGVVKSHYLDSELNGNAEMNLSVFSYINPSSTLLDRGLSDLNTTENWIALNNTNFGNLPSSFGVIEHGIGVSTSNVITWDGSESTDWFDPYNWTPAEAPDATKIVIIPNATTTPNDPLIADNGVSSVHTISIQAEGILNSGLNTVLTVVGASGAWSNNGILNAGTGKVIFNNGVPSEIVTIAGVTDFYNIEAGANTTLQPVAGSTIRIANVGTASATSIVDFSTINNTVEYNGVNQTIVNPNGISISGYYNLILSGSGIKTMPSSVLTVKGDFTTSGTATATALQSVNVNGNATIGAGSTFNTGAFQHAIGGNFVNNGTFNAALGGKITFNGTISQAISGTSTTTFDNLTIDNILNVTQSSNVNVNNVLLLNGGKLIIGNNTLGINGTINNPSGTIEVNTTSNLTFGGTSAFVLNNNLFSASPSINNLTINRSGGVTLGNQSMTVGGVLELTSGILTLGANTLTVSGSSPTVAAGKIDVSHGQATIAFTNTSAITLPATVFNGAINNFTVNGTGGVAASGNFTVNGVLNLQSANPSATKGSLDMAVNTLNMGVLATTIGTGDVTGIVKRAHTFSNGVEYSFGNQFTSLNFLDVPGNLKPTWVSCKIEIGTAPTWRNEAINRRYSFAQSGGNDRMIVKLHYLDSELHDTETDEANLVFWDGYNPDQITANNFTKFFPRNKSGNSTTNNWVQLSGPAINYLATSDVLDVKQWGLAYTNVSQHTWIGLGSVSYPGDWSLPGHWEGGVPTADDDVVIPTTLASGNSGYPYRNLLPILIPANAKSINIQSSASLTSDTYDITVSGFNDAWINNGVFSPGKGTVIFNHGEPTEIVNLVGTTNFNNLTVANKTHLKASLNSITRIAGALNTETSSILDFTSNINTVAYNGISSQNITNQPTEITGGYHHLVLSEAGTKVFSPNELKIYGNLTTNAAVTATGNTLTIIGTTAQSISGSVIPTLNNLTIANTTANVTAGVTLNNAGDFINLGTLDMAAYDLAVAGNVTNSGIVKTASVSSVPLPISKIWGGSVEYYTTTGGQTVVNGTFNNLSLTNTSSNQTANGNLTVNGTLTTSLGGVLSMDVYQLLGSLATISNSGTIQTKNTSATPIPTGKTWGGIVKYNALTGAQTVMTGVYNNLTSSNTSGTQNASGDLVVTSFNTTNGGTLNMGSNLLSGLTTLAHNGILRTQNTSSTPFTAGLTWGGTIVFDGVSGQIIPASSIFNNFTVSNTLGVTSTSNQTINGILNLSIANPDATHGSLDMDTYTLNFGVNATTIGVGDVTGSMTRTSFETNKIYTYGNTNQYVLFPVKTGQTLPTSFTLRVTLLATAPTWTTNAIKRSYEIAQSGGNATSAIFRANYLDAELPSGVDESLLSFWQNIDPSGSATITERGKSDDDVNENWIAFSDADFGQIPSVLGYFQVAIGTTQYEIVTWDGSKNTTNWSDNENWTPQFVPTSSLGIVIPNISNSNNISPILPVSAVGKYIVIKNGGILNTITGATLTLSGTGNAWDMELGGVFNSGDSNVLFDGNISNGSVAISGSTDFYDLTVGINTTLRPGTNSYTGIKGTLVNNGILDAATNHNIIEFKKDGSFTIPNPNGSTPGYHTLVISGTGTKTLPSSLDIWHDFTNNGAVEAGTGLVTINGNYSLQTIGGSSVTDFYDLTINNTSGTVATNADITVENTLTINTGAVLEPGVANIIGGIGTLTGSGSAKVTGLLGINSFCTQYSIAIKNLTNLMVDYNGAGDQTVCAVNYGNLVISTNGTRNVTFVDSGIIGVSGIFNPDLTTTTYTITGSTLEANGTGSQTVPAFNYYNVNVSGVRTGGSVITLVNGGTIGIAGHSTVTATGATYEIVGNTIDFNGSNNQTIDPFSFYNVIFSNPTTVTTTGNLVVYGAFTVLSDATLNMDASSLSGTFSGGISNNGTIQTANTSETPLPTGKNWGGIIEYTSSTSQTVVAATYNNLTMSGVGGGIIGTDITVNGLLDLNQVNPSASQGILHTGSNTLNMGENATTEGLGDVTGMVKREHSFVNGIEYSFGNQFTSLNFLGVPNGIKPDWVVCKIEIGTAPTWRDVAIKRNYSFAQSGGNDRMIVKLHYLDTELNTTSVLPYEVDETQLVFWDAYNLDLVTPNSFIKLFPRNKNDNDATNNWIQLTGPAINYIATSSILDVKQWGLSYTNVLKHTWTGNGSPSYDGDWSLPGNWDGGVPTATDDVLISVTLPDDSNGDYPYRNLLSAIVPAEVKTLEIESGAIVYANDFDISIYGSTNAWVNNGTFIAGTKAVTFANGSTSNTATIAGATNFYDLIVQDNTKIQAATGGILGIGGELNIGTGSIADFGSTINTVEYNGNNSQNIVNPNGVIPGYSNLVLSSSGTKIFPASSLSISGDLTINATVSTTGNTTVMSGTVSQIISGNKPVTFNNLSINNTEGVLLNMDNLSTISGNLVINNNAILEVAAAKQLTATGSITNSGGATGLVLKSSAEGTASLLHNSAAVPATVERYISGAAEDWHFLSSPIANQEIGGDWLPTGGISPYGNNTRYDLYIWDEPTPCWVFQPGGSTPSWASIHPQTNFVPGRGYLYSLKDEEPTKEFAGNLNNGTVSYPVTANNTTDLLLKGFNLIGNPYPSSINWKASSGWTRSNLLNSGGGKDMWIWNPAANNYGVCNSVGLSTNGVTQYIAPMQGFFVQAASNDNIVMTNDIRLHEGASNWMRPTNTIIGLDPIKVRIESESVGYDEVILQFGAEANMPGAAKLRSTTNTSLTTYIPFDKKEYTVHYFTDTIQNPTIPLNFEAKVKGAYTIQFNFNATNYSTVLLEDTKTNSIHNILENPTYTFNASVSDKANRFVIHFRPIGTPVNELPANVYYNGEFIVVDVSAIQTPTVIQIYDLLGRTILNKNVEGNTIHYLPVYNKELVYIVKMKSNGMELTKKIVIY